jgi:hypothetical protein
VYEGWTIIDSAYFTTVTVTTVGFGDRAPAERAGERSIVCRRLCVGSYMLVVGSEWGRRPCADDATAV